jgi:hypothetical protein
MSHNISPERCCICFARRIQTHRWNRNTSSPLTRSIGIYGRAMPGPILTQDKATPLPQSYVNELNQQELYEREKRTEGVGIDVLTTSARLFLHAQATQQYQGVVGRSLAESKEWWPEPVQATAGAQTYCGSY